MIKFISKLLSPKTCVVFTFLTITVSGYGQEDHPERKLNLDVGADLVSAYVWRGMYQAGVSIQPTLSLSALGFTIGAWGSTDFSTPFKEIDFYLSYEISGFTVGIADYWWNGEGTSYFIDRGSHHIEATLGFTFPEKFPLSLEINTLLTGDEDKDEVCKKYFSTNISASFPFSVKEIDFEMGIGVSPRKGMYGDKAGIAAITAKATKNLQLSAKYALPVYVELIFSPAQDNAFLVFGVRF
ncbi:MAG: hypothetical protein LBC84_10245 [Prevotellaceae bacterium]|jgi:hypothetical protein|nr:hypothetical protein [Prevotellaceae bacterium]